MADTPEITPERRAEAARAMEDEAHTRARAEASALVAKRRDEAIRAMEGQEWRKKRLERERLSGKQTAELEAELAAQKKQAMNAATAQQASLAERQQKEAATQAAFNRRVDEIESSERVIDRLKEAPAALSPLRTLKSDMAEAVRVEGMSVAKIALAEQARRPVVPPPPPARRRSSWPLILLILVLLGSGGAGGWWWWQQRPRTSSPVIPAAQVPAPLIASEASEGIALTPNSSVSAIYLALNNAANSDADSTWSVKQLYLVQNEQVLGWSSTAKLLGLTVPDGLARVLADNYMIGLWRQDSSTDRFIVLKTSLYNNARAGLLQWEPQMGALLPLFYQPPPQLAVAISFTDKLVRNKDARILKAANQTPVLFYAFLDNETILITTNEAAFTALYQRFLETKK